MTPQALNQAWDMVDRLGLYLALTFALVFVGAVVAVLAGARRPVAVVASGLFGWAAAGYLAVYIYLANPDVGRKFSYIVLGAAILGSVILPRLLDSAGRATLATLAPGVLTTVAAVFFVVCLGFVFGGFDRPVGTPAIRFIESTQTLPSDNAIPYFFANALYSHHRPIPSPLFPDWLSSDRPPLQSGLTLLLMPLFSKRHSGYLDYQLVGVIAQSVWILPLWAWLRAARVGSVAIAMALGTILLTGFTLLNMFYVWPKLLPAAFLLVLAGFVMVPSAARPQHLKLAGLGAGLSAGFAMMGHEGSAFALAGMALLLLVLRRVPPVPTIAVAAIALVVVMAPWWWYQKFYDPPGDRLLKYHLAGHRSVTSRSFAAVLAEAYGRVGVGGAIANKITNFEDLFGNFPEMARHAAGVALRLPDLARPHHRTPLFLAAALVRRDQFVHLFPGLGFLSLGPLFLLATWWPRRSAGRAPPELAAAAVAWAFVAMTVVPWCLAMFGPYGTEPFAGTFVVQLVAMAGTVLAAWAWNHRAAVVLCAAQVILNLLLYVALTPEPGPFLTRVHPAFNPLLAALTVGAGVMLLAGLALVGAQPVEDGLQLGHEPASELGDGKAPAGGPAGLPQPAP